MCVRVYLPFFSVFIYKRIGCRSQIAKLSTKQQRQKQKQIHQHTFRTHNKEHTLKLKHSLSHDSQLSRESL